MHPPRLVALCAFVLVIAGLVASGCHDETPTTVVPSAGTVTVHFSHSVDGELLVRNSIRYTNAAGDLYSLERLDYLISHVELVASDGARFTSPGPFHIEAVFFNSDTDTLVPLPRPDEFELQVPPGTYNQIQFLFGLDETVNNTSEFELEPWHGRMSWPDLLGGGYHYMILDGRVSLTNPPTDPPTERGLNTHLGRTGKDPHYFQVTLDVPSFTVNANETNLVIAHDLNQWFEAPNVYAFPDPALIMDNPDIQEILKANGATVFSIAVTP